MTGLPGHVADALRSPGRALAEQDRAYMEPRFQRDFSDVRIHTDPIAAKSAARVKASAYAFGNHIVFGQGGAASSTAGRHLLAHELAHVVQQRGGSPAPTASGVQSAESAAEASADRVTAGRGVAVGGDIAPTILCNRSYEQKRSLAAELDEEDDAEDSADGAMQAARRSRDKQASLGREAARQDLRDASKEPKELASEIATKAFEKMERRAMAPGANNLSDDRKMKILKKVNRIYPAVDIPQKASRKGDLNEALNTPRGPTVIRQAESTAGFPGKPEERYRNANVGSHTRSDFMTWRRSSDGRVEWISVNLKYYNIDELTNELDARSRVRDILYQAVRNKFHLSRLDRPVKLVVAFAFVPTPEVQEVIKHELFREGIDTPIDEIHFGPPSRVPTPKVQKVIKHELFREGIDTPVDEIYSDPPSCSVIHLERDYKPPSGRQPLDVDGKARRKRLKVESLLKKQQAAASSAPKSAAVSRKPQGLITTRVSSDYALLKGSVDEAAEALPLNLDAHDFSQLSTGRARDAARLIRDEAAKHRELLQPEARLTLRFLKTPKPEVRKAILEGVFGAKTKLPIDEVHFGPEVIRRENYGAASAKQPPTPTPTPTPRAMLSAPKGKKQTNLPDVPESAVVANVPRQLTPGEPPSAQTHESYDANTDDTRALASISRRKAHVATRRYFKDQVQLDIEEYVGEPKPFKVTTTFSLTADASIQAESSSSATAGGGHLGASGKLNVASSRWMTADEKDTFVKGVAGGGGRGRQPELTIIELIATGNLESTRQALLALGGMSERMSGDIGSSQEVSIEGDLEVGVNGRGTSATPIAIGAAVEAAASVGGGKTVSRTLMTGDREMYAVSFIDRAHASGSISLSLEVASIGAKGSKTDKQTQTTRFLLDFSSTPSAERAARCKSELLWAGGHEQVLDIARRYPEFMHGGSDSSVQERSGAVPVGLLGVTGSLVQGSTREDSVSTDPSGTTNRVAGSSSIGPNMAAFGRTWDLFSTTDSLAVNVGTDNTANGVTQAEQISIDLGKTAANLAESMRQSPIAALRGATTGSKEIIKRRADVVGTNLSDASFDRVSQLAMNPSEWFSKWDGRGTSQGAASEWEQTRKKMLAAKGSRLQIARALRDWEAADSGRSADISRLAGDTGIAFEFPDEIADQKFVFDQLLDPGLLAPSLELARQNPTAALEKTRALERRVTELAKTLQGRAGSMSSPDTFAEMQRRLAAAAYAIRQASADIERLMLQRQSADPAAASAQATRGAADPSTDPGLTASPANPSLVAPNPESLAIDIRFQIRVCMANRELEARVFSEIEDELSSWDVNLLAVGRKLTQLKSMYESWGEAVTAIGQDRVALGFSPDAACRFGPDRTRWQALDDRREQYNTLSPRSRK
ncbi:hypothetical protein RA210_U10643 [Rubrivivax sp. A210]|uniref:eCIS core domain-containing protein n=1 Tax=Rubrivivax sp. A210 TaxID=2772301 RepID=UPI00191ADD0C|nr:DUF4157 domain-containing protein [Rubrivivax sp. A210]CAD5367073.1 hypothetical protein RA210_U10643 [Rubrivivax sp. A210]